MYVVEAKSERAKLVWFCLIGLSQGSHSQSGCYVSQGLENLDPSKPTVFAVNHQSGLDAFILAHLGHVNFKCTFKREILFYPGRLVVQGGRIGHNNTWVDV